MPQATIVQQNYARGSTYPVVSTWAVQPQNSNLLVALVAGFKQTLPVPAGWTLSFSYTGQPNNACYIYTKVAGASEPLTVNWAAGTDWINVGMFEIVNYSGNLTANGSSSTIATITANLTAAANPARTLRYIANEVDGGNGVPLGNPINNLAPTLAWSVIGNNHTATYQSLDPAFAGDWPMPMTNNGFPVYVDLKLEGASSKPLQRGIAFARNFADLAMTLPNAPVNGNQLFIISMGGSGDTFNTPAGWTVVFNANDNSFQRTIVYTKTASSDPALTTLVRTGGSNWWTAMLIEVSGCTPTYAHGAGGTTNVVYAAPQSGNFAAAYANGLSLTIIENDTSFSIVSTSEGSTVLSPGSWHPPVSGNHPAVILLIDDAHQDSMSYITASDPMSFTATLALQIEDGTNGAGAGQSRIVNMG